jgi:N-dimethylarginine dimethylaminohydrolase
MRFGLDSEYTRLTSVLLYVPDEVIADHPAPEEVQHLAPVDHGKLSLEFAALIDSYDKLGIAVTILPHPDDPSDSSHYNMMFCRDLLFMTPQGAILANMAHATRQSEPAHAATGLEHAGIPVLHRISGEGRFEGADALWIRKDLVAVGVGNRTNREGYEQFRNILAGFNVEAVALPSTQRTTQHLLGSVQIVDKDLALVRSALVSPETTAFLLRNGFRIVSIPENHEVRTRQAMNIVTIAPSKVFMTAGCPETKEMYLDTGIDVAAELHISQLINGAGGLACATGTLARNSS